MVLMMNGHADHFGSKPLGHDYESGFLFAQEMLCGDKTAAVNFDRLQKHPVRGYIIFEYLLCEEGQTVTPYTSHPRRYWEKNKMKFLSLWRVAKSLNATLYLVNYAKKGTLHEDEILLIHVLDMDENGIKELPPQKGTRKEFSTWFRKLNRECMANYHEVTMDIKYDFFHMNAEDMGEVKLEFGKHRGKQIREIVEEADTGEYTYILKCYLSKLETNKKTGD